MVNTKHLLKVSALWISMVYAICFAGVLFFPGIRTWFMLYGLHASVDLGQNMATLGTFFSGLVIWNIIVLLSAWLFAALFNSIRK